MNLLVLKNIKKSYEDGFNLDINKLAFRRGQVYVIMGGNGSGKTTLLNIAGLMEMPDTGEIIIDGVVISYSSKDILKIRHKIGYLMQNSFLFSKSVSDNVAYGLKQRKFSQKETEKRVNESLNCLGIEYLKNRNVKELSGGEKKRVAIAQVLVLNTDIILMDEPMAYVDTATVNIIEKLLHNSNNLSGKTIIITTHSVETAYRLSADIINLKSGHLDDFIHENVFYGNIEQSDNGIKVMKLNATVEIYLIAQKLGSAHIAIDPESILLSRNSFVSSARNSLYGTITKIESVGVNVRVFVDCGVEFCALITKKSYLDIKLNIGNSVYLYFKVNSVKVI